MSDEKEMVGYRQQPGKLPFSRPGSGGKDQFSDLRDEDLIPESQVENNIKSGGNIVMMS